MCGEDMVSLYGPLASPGASPRVWGVYRNGTDVVRKLRVIPTCVGSIGLSPMSIRGMKRFIPTCMGRIRCIDLCHYRGEGHPHVCGACSE